MKTYVILRRGGWPSGEELQRAAARSTEGLLHLEGGRRTGEVCNAVYVLIGQLLGTDDGHRGTWPSQRVQSSITKGARITSALAATYGDWWWSA